jgi:hypothetical protein
LKKRYRHTSPQSKFNSNWIASDSVGLNRHAIYQQVKQLCFRACSDQGHIFHILGGNKYERNE